MAGDDAVWYSRGERLEDGVDDRHRVGHPHAHGIWPLSADHPPHRHDHLQVAEAAVIHWIIGRGGQAFKRDLRASNAGRHSRIVKASHLTTDLRQVDGHLVSTLLHTDSDRNFFADLEAIVVHE